MENPLPLFLARLEFSFPCDFLFACLFVCILFGRGIPILVMVMNFPASFGGDEQAISKAS